jgi:hypothetical protein
MFTTASPHRAAATRSAAAAACVPYKAKRHIAVHYRLATAVPVRAPAVAGRQHRRHHHQSTSRVWVLGSIPASLLIFWYCFKRKSKVEYKPLNPSPVLVPFCKACNLPIDFDKDKYVVQFGANLHAECLKCSICSRKQTSAPSGFLSFWQKKGWSENSPDKEIYMCCNGDWKPSDGWKSRLMCFRHYIQRCSPNCCVCGKNVIGRRDVAICPSGEVFCSHHHSSINKSRLCYNCSRSELMAGCQPFLDTVPKSQLTCKKCRDEGLLLTDSILKACTGIVMRVFRHLGLDVDEFEIQMQLQSQEWFEQLVPGKFNYPHYEGVTIKRREAFGLVRRCDIVIRWNLSISHALLVIAHEFSHAYFHFKKIDGLPTEIEEQACEMIAYLVLTTIMNNEDLTNYIFDGRIQPIMTHLRRFRSSSTTTVEPWESFAAKFICPKMSLPQFLEHLQTFKSLPEKNMEVRTAS